MQSMTIYFSTNFVTATDPKSIALLISMLAYCDPEMMKIVDDDGSEVFYKLTRQ